MSPVIILDESHKAYSDTARDILRGLNPAMLVELSATPPPESNRLVDIKGMDLAREDMIKLDLHVITKTASDWKMTLLAAKEKRDALEKKAATYEAQSSRHIRPICLIQVERTGKDQRGGKMIHAEDAREYLINTCGISSEQVAVKSSEKDDIEGIDLLSRDCPVRYIITKQALQEGWDCSFAYVLAILTNPGSENSLTQLVGRILRQPEARKTKVRDLDESYVFCFQQRADNILKDIKDGFEREGLGDLKGSILPSDGGGPEDAGRAIPVRPKFRAVQEKTFLPVFVVRNGRGWRRVDHETDILSRIDWKKADFSELRDLPLSTAGTTGGTDITVALSKDEESVIRQTGLTRLATGGLEGVDPVFVTRQLLDALPNPWLAHDVAADLLARLTKKHGAEKVAANLVYIIDEARKTAEKERNRMARAVFEDLLEAGDLKFLMFKEDPGYRFPKKIPFPPKSKALVRDDNTPLQLSLFEQFPEDAFNSTEKAVALYLESQKQMLWWYRNRSRNDYAIQGWKKHRIYADFVLSGKGSVVREKPGKATVYVVETKGAHLKNEDTDYKKEVFALCNKLADGRPWTELGLGFEKSDLRFEVVFGDEWERKLNVLLGGKS